MSLELKLIDGAIALMTAAVRRNELLARARAENRTVTQEEYDALIAESDDLEQQWRDAENGP